MTDAPPEPGPRFPLPRPHFLGLAPVDVWLRLVWAGRRGVRARYALRAAFCLWTSVIGTVVTLPERALLAPYLWWRFGRGRARLDEGPPVVVVLGYYRSGTTHLHYLLSCDGRFVTPRWVQVAAASGWALSWAVLRWAMIPMTPNRRPQDDVAFGPDWPAEDDFALAGWSLASALPWRYVFPHREDLVRKWHFLDGVTEREASRFARTLAAFCWKVSALRPGRRVVLKTPSHTARVKALVEVFGERVRFVHIVRDPEAVMRSNARMVRRLEGYLLEDPPPIAHRREQIAREYEQTERAAHDALDALAPGRFSRVRYQDLVNDPRGELARVYGELGLGWDGALDERVTAYLHAVRAYRTRDQQADHRKDEQAEPSIGEAGELERSVCARLNEQFHTEPAVDARPLPEVPGKDPSSARARAAWIATPIAAAACLGAWLAAAHFTGNRFDAFVWVWGTLIGLVTLRAAGRGTRALGAWAAFWFVVMVGASVYPLPEFANGWVGVDRVKAIRTAYGTPNNNYIWIVLGALAAWRYASREHVRPPGR